MIDIYRKKYLSSGVNTSIISLAQRTVDIITLALTPYLVCLYFNYKLTEDIIIYALMVLCFYQANAGVSELYRSWRGVRFKNEIKSIYKVWMLSFVVVSTIMYLTKIMSVKNEFYIQCFFMYVIFIFFMRFSVRIIVSVFRRFGYNTRKVVFVGDLSSCDTLSNNLTENHWLGFKVLGGYSDEINNSSIKLLGGYEKLVLDAKNGDFDRVYLSSSSKSREIIDEILFELADTTCSVYFIPDIFRYQILHSKIEEIEGIPIVPLYDTALSGVNRILKRIEDIIISSIILIFISPILLLISIVVKLNSKGPIIFKQTRYGMDGKAIKIWKFRTMKVMENQIVIQAKKNDPRITKVGGFLRKTSLDELPQFINVLFGEMSIVGPRPHAVSHNEEYRRKIKGYMLRHKVKPGITGLAQINGWRGETDTLEKMEKRIEYDLIYIKNWSIWLDLKIIFITIFKGFINKSAY